MYSQVFNALKAKVKQEVCSYVFFEKNWQNEKLVTPQAIIIFDEVELGDIDGANQKQTNLRFKVVIINKTILENLDLAEKVIELNGWHCGVGKTSNVELLTINNLQEAEQLNNYSIIEAHFSIGCLVGADEEETYQPNTLTTDGQISASQFN